MDKARFKILWLIYTIQAQVNTGEVNNTDYLFIMTPGIYQATHEHFVLRVDVLEAGKMGSVRI